MFVLEAIMSVTFLDIRSYNSSISAYCRDKYII